MLPIAIRTIKNKDRSITEDEINYQAVHTPTSKCVGISSEMEFPNKLIFVKIWFQKFVAS